jgi:hypothetical protein
MNQVPRLRPRDIPTMIPRLDSSRGGARMPAAGDRGGNSGARQRTVGAEVSHNSHGSESPVTAGPRHQDHPARYQHPVHLPERPHRLGEVLERRMLLRR